MLNRTLTTNVLRNKWDKYFSSLCTFCNTYSETTVHLLYKCDLVCPLWKKLERIINYFYQIKLDIDLKLVLLNNYQGPGKEIVNLLVIIMKQFIYATKCAQDIPDFIKYMSKVSYWYRIGKQITLDTNKWKKVQKKWKNLFA